MQDLDDARVDGVQTRPEICDSAGNQAKVFRNQEMLAKPSSWLRIRTKDQSDVK